jgi:hypothetical protein
MKSDTLIRIEGMEALMEKLDLVDAERFITLIKKEPFDYTRWQETLYEGMSVEDICAEVIARRARMEKVKTMPAKSQKTTGTKKPVKHRKAVKLARA